MSTTNNQLHSAVPPTYEECLLQNDLWGTTNTTDDGRVKIDLDSKLARTLARVTHLPNDTDTSIHSPPYTLFEWKTSLNIVIQVVGSRGDVQPFVALGQELQRIGHNVRIATHDTFRDFIKQANLRFYPIGGDPVELMAYMVKNPGLIPKMRTLREGEIKKKRQMIREMLSGCWNSCIKPDVETKEPFVADAIIANPPSFAHIHCAQAMGIPVHIMFTMPWSQTQAFPHPLASIMPSNVGMGMANYLSYGLVQTLTWQGLADVINSFRQSLGLEQVPLTEGPFLAETLQVPHTYCWSPSLVPKPKDWPDHIDVCGFFFRSPPEYTPSTRLQKFLDYGRPPIYIGFGSIVVDNADAITQTIIEAVQISGVRAIVSAGWSKLGKNCNYTGDDILFLDEDCPHEWLFPRVAAVVHHGGAGTTACGLLNGRPTLIIPFFGDQFFWGDMIAKAGAAARPIRRHDLNSKTLSDAINFLLTPQVASRAADIAAGMKMENGVSAAVESFHRHLPRDKLCCDIAQKMPASWLCRVSEKITKLSGPVVEILLRNGKVKPKHLTPYYANPIHINNRRWEPLTAVVSSLTGTSFDVLEASNSIWRSPYDIHKRAKASRDGKLTAKDVAAMVGGSVMCIPKLYGATFKGFLMDLPLAVTEGLRATPKLYGGHVKDHDPVVDWKSGIVVATKTFGENLSGSIHDIMTLPAEGAKQEGIIGLGKGIGKGVTGLLTKSGAAITGLVAYPAQGISKSIYAALASGTRKAVVDARRAHALAQIDGGLVSQHVQHEWIQRFEEMNAPQQIPAVREEK